MTDLVLSSGFLAFARQAGFLAAIEEAGIPVGGICGTSSGALAGALWAAGHSAERIATELSATIPLRHVRLHWRPWRGAFDLRGMRRRLADLLPARIEDLERPFGVGVMGRRGEPVLLDAGPLPDAVAASCAIPGLFAPVPIGGVPYQDGGLTDRTFLSAWRARRPDARVLLHLVDSRDGTAVVPEEEGVTVVRSGRSGAKLWSLGDFQGQLRETRARTLRALAGARAPE